MIFRNISISTLDFRYILSRTIIKYVEKLNEESLQIHLRSIEKKNLQNSQRTLNWYEEKSLKPRLARHSFSPLVIQKSLDGSL